MYNIYIETYGCSANQNNSEIMAGLLARAGFNIVNNPEIADVIIINTCIVKGLTLQRMLFRIKKLSKKFSRLIVAGCLPDVMADRIKELANTAVIGSHNFKDITKAVKGIFEGKKIQIIDKNNEIKLCMPKISKSKVIGITQISEGCIGSCSYCAVKLAKGKLFSYPAEEILKNVRSDLDSGCKEIWLTSQNNAAYGLDSDEKLTELLEKILALKGKFFLRLGMMNPNNVLQILPGLIEIFKNKKIYKFLHLPLQSGSDSVLKAMKREYKVKDWLKIVNKFKKEIPELTISTDIICGFPTETAIDFEKTLELIMQVKPDILNISKFSAMPGTEAAKLKQLSTQEIKKRSRILSKLHNEIALGNNKKWLGWQGTCLVNGKGFQDTWLARNVFYKLIILKSEDNLLGKTLNIKIADAKSNYLLGKIVPTKNNN